MAFEAHLSRGRVALVVAILLVFEGIGLWLVFGAPPGAKGRLAGWAMSLLFGMAIPAMAAKLFQSGVVLRVDSVGVYTRDWSEQVIPWGALTGITVRYNTLGLVKSSQPGFVGLELHNPAAYPYRGPNMFQKYGRKTGFGDITLAVGDTDRSIDELLQAIEAFKPPGLPITERRG